MFARKHLQHELNTAAHRSLHDETKEYMLETIIKQLQKVSQESEEIATNSVSLC
ncbi:MAG: hypothetical protein HOM36_04820 [Phycisphaerae bacterium]|jgi:hypothetical protein|nr:hypothetical protein [Phycisphaerae bacterium]